MDGATRGELRWDEGIALVLAARATVAERGSSLSARQALACFERAWPAGRSIAHGDERLVALALALGGRLSDDTVALRRRVREALGDGRALCLRASGRALRVAAATAREAPATPAALRAVEEPESIHNPRWSRTRVPVGAAVSAVVSHADLKSPLAAVIVVTEVDGAGREEVARIRTTIPAGSGDHAVAWRRSPDDAAADLDADAAAGDGRPLEYRFRVESARLSCAGESGPLWLTNTVTVDVVRGEERRALDTPRIVALTDALGDERRARSERGRARFEDVLVGPVRIRVASPSFANLAWSEPRVPVGEAAAARFSYDDAIEGMEVAVVVYEVNRDGTSDEVHREEVTLGGVRGEASVSFTRSEEEAERDVADDVDEGDEGPVEYRFTVAAEGRETAWSTALWLTHTVAVRVEDTAEEGRYPAGVEVVLTAADGTEHRAPFTGDEASFDGVVCGPMSVRLDFARTEAR